LKEGLSKINAVRTNLFGKERGNYLVDLMSAGEMHLKKVEE